MAASIGANISAFGAEFAPAQLLRNPPVLVGVVPLLKVQTYVVTET